MGLHPVLEAIKARRGYILPHHRLLTLLSPELAKSYDATYGALALDPLVLADRDKELIWLVIVATVGSATAGHHVRRFRAAGGSEAEIAAALRLAAFAAGRGTFPFAAAHWDLPGFDADAAYRTGLAALLSDVALPAAMTEPALAAAYTCRQDEAGIALHIVGSCRAGVQDRALAEALALTIQPAGLPGFNIAGRIWRDLIRAGTVEASAELRDWAMDLA